MKPSVTVLLVLFATGGSACSDISPALPSGFQPGMHRPRRLHTATLLGGGAYAGCVVVVGGLDADKQAVGEIELYDPKLDAWRILETRAPRVFHTATWVNSGEAGYLLIAGGYGSDYQPMQDALRIYGDGMIDAEWPMPARAEHSATPLEDGRVLFAGGGPLVSQIYDPTREPFWAQGPELGGPEAAEEGLHGNLFGHASVLLDSGQVLLVGGARDAFYDERGIYTGQGEARAEAWLCDVNASHCERAPPPRSPRQPRTHAAVPLNVADAPGTLVLGGQVASEYRDPNTGEWRAPPPWIPFTSPSSAAILDVGREIVVLGGFIKGIDSLQTGEILRPSLGQFREAIMQVPRVGHTATLLGDSSRLLVAGGITSLSSSEGPLGSSEILDLTGDATVAEGPVAATAPGEQLASPLSCALEPSFGGGGGAGLIGLAVFGWLARRRAHRSWLERLPWPLMLLQLACADDMTALEAARPLRGVDASGITVETLDAGAEAALNAAIQPPLASPTLTVTWSRIPLPEPRPGPRLLSTVVADPTQKQLVLFGGASIGGGLGDTWTLDLGTTPAWVQSSGLAPSVRAAHAMTYSPEAGVAILFGGIAETPLGDTWSHGSGGWQDICGPGCAAPPPRHGHAMVYDAARENVVLFGGRNDTSPLDDTWIWSSTDGWVDPCGGTLAANPCGGPDPRYHHGLLYDERTQSVVLYGGTNESGALNDTWLWDGHGWAQHTGGRLNGLAAHAGHTFGYDPNAEIWVAFGGVVRNAPSAAVWGYSDIDDKVWIPGAFPSPPPAARAFGQMTWDPVGQRFLVFGGGLEGQFHDLWALEVEYHSKFRDCITACAEPCTDDSSASCPAACAGAGVPACSDLASDAGVDAGDP